MPCCAVEKLKELASQTLQCVWYPFTQHKGLNPTDITVIDARSGEDMLVVKGNGIEPNFDACASWWTQVGALIAAVPESYYLHIFAPYFPSFATHKTTGWALGNFGSNCTVLPQTSPSFATILAGLPGSTGLEAAGKTAAFQRKLLIRYPLTTTPASLARCIPLALARMLACLFGPRKVSCLK